ncbi:MAG: SDR family oxidoreductase [Gammaproteobacteria bacterium]|nr:SDR family oxidoreductase [Gammaproteobacteria bacterium]
MFSQNLLQGRTAFVAGGTSGINRGIAAALAKAGASIAVMSRNPEKVEDTVGFLSGFRENATVLGFPGDVRDYDSVRDALGKTSDEFGPLDVVVSGAAGLFIAPAGKMSANAFKTVVDIDLLGTFNVLRAAYELCRKPGASFINISAPQATEPYWGQAHACAAKAGVNMLTKALAYEWGAIGIRVNAIVPGPIEGTEGLRKFSAVPELNKVLLDSVPNGHFGTVDDISNMALYLASDAAAYINGEIIRVDGGQALSGGMKIDPEWLG